MKKAIVISKHIHSTFASWSSSDVTVYVELTEKPDFSVLVEEGDRIESKKFPLFNNERVKYVTKDKQCIHIAVSSDETFCIVGNFGKSYEKTEGFKELVKSYIDKGYSKEKPISLMELYERKEERERQRAKRAGLVLWMGYDQYKGHPEYFQGGFSDILFNCKNLKKYVGNGNSVHGWIGHYGGRTVANDKTIESGLKKKDSPLTKCLTGFHQKAEDISVIHLKAIQRRNKRIKLKRTLIACSTIV